MPILAFAFLALSFSLAQASSDDLKDVLHKCLRTNDAVECEISTSVLWGAGDYPDAFTAAERHCDLKAEGCGQLYFLAVKIGPGMVDVAIEKLSRKCAKNADACEALANAYEEANEPPLALKAAKRYYDKNGKGIYSWLAYKYGTDKEFAFKEGLKACRADHGHCDFSLRYLPDHPQRAELLRHAEEGCKENTGKSWGATSCTIVGSYYYKMKDYAKAYDLWNLDCKNNVTACLLVLGLKDLAPEKADLAMKNFCQNKQQGMNFSEARLREENCGVTTAQRIPASVAKQAAELVESFQQEQK